MSDRLEEILQLFQRDIEKRYGGRTIGKTYSGEEALKLRQPTTAV